MTTNRSVKRAGVRFGAVLACVLVAGLGGAADPVVINVRATQLPDKTVEVLYDLVGAPARGATVSVVFSQDGGATYTITPVPAALSGHVGAGVASGTDRRMVWNVPVTLPPQFYKTTMMAAVTAVDPAGSGAEITIYLGPGNTVPMVLVRIPAGTFTMGAPTTERGYLVGEDPPHQVTLTQAYYLGKTEVTQRQWVAVMGVNPASGYGVGDDYPVYSVSWNDICGGAMGSSCTAGSFIGKVNTLLGSTVYRMPTEAEWERGARGETTTEFSFAVPASWSLTCGSIPEATAYMWWCGNNTPYGSKAVATKQANPYGLYDMHGNVYEWVGDWVGSYSSSAVTDPPGPAGGSYRVFRGCSWESSAQYCRSAGRGGGSPDGRYYWVGFRLARPL